MFVYLSKLLPLFVFPLGMVTLLLVLGLSTERRKKWHKAFLVLALIILHLGSNRWVSYRLARSLEWQNLPSETHPQAEVIVVLGGGTESGDFPRPMAEVNGAGDRVLYAAKLYHDGAAPMILVSGGNLDFSSARGTSPAEEMTDLLIMLSVPPEAIWQQDQSQNTYEDALYSAEILREKEITEVILVTSAIHMPRAKALFENQGIDVIPAPTDFTVTEQNWQSVFQPSIGELVINLLPNASALDLTTTVIKEYIGLLVYHLRGWL
ncbi:MAG: YdcF family protein [Anaerolineaceae bacterium]|nr:YdcF family protein [Anaerolineaceae bacterium]